MQTHRRRRKALVWLAALAVLIAAVAWWRSQAGDDETPRRSPPVAPVIVEPVRFATQRTRLEAVGTAQAQRAVTLHSAAAGEVVEVLFRAGDRIAAGAPLLQLDARRERLALQQAKVDLRDAEQLLRRYERTGHTGAVPANLVDQGRTAVDAARLALRRAEVELADRTLRAPFDGHVGFTEVDVGDRVTADTAVASFDDRGALLVDFALPEAQLHAVQGGTAVSAQPWHGGAAVAGVIERIDTRVDPAQRSFRVRARFDNADDALRPGASLRIALELQGRRYPLLPEEALVWGGEGSTLWKVADGRAERVPALIIERRDGQVLVDAALAEGDRIVAEGVQRLREGMQVRIDAPTPESVPAAERAAPQAATPAGERTTARR